MPISTPYHEGELAVQQQVNETEMARMNAAAIDKTILAGVLRFIEQQPMLIIATIDAEGRVWVSVLFGNPGFLRALDDHTLEINLSRSCSAQDEREKFPANALLLTLKELIPIAPNTFSVVFGKDRSQKNPSSLYEAPGGNTKRNTENIDRRRRYTLCGQCSSRPWC